LQKMESMNFAKGLVHTGSTLATPWEENSSLPKYCLDAYSL
jgi:hypothetical protein